jgi:hypothetical protein
MVGQSQYRQQVPIAKIPLDEPFFRGVDDARGGLQFRMGNIRWTTLYRVTEVACVALGLNEICCELRSGKVS